MDILSNLHATTAVQNPILLAAFRRRARDPEITINKQKKRTHRTAQQYNKSCNNRNKI